MGEQLPETAESFKEDNSNDIVVLASYKKL
jgi:hypothetical protein